MSIPFESMVRTVDTISPNPVCTRVYSFSQTHTHTHTHTHTIVALPTIIMNPQEQLNVKAASDVTFSVTAEGGSLLYQWQKDGMDIMDTPFKYSGTTTSTLTVINVHYPEDEGFYSAVVANIAGSTDTVPVQLTVGEMLECKLLMHR